MGPVSRELHDRLARSLVPSGVASRFLGFRRRILATEGGAQPSAHLASPRVCGTSPWGLPGGRPCEARESHVQGGAKTLVARDLARRRAYLRVLLALPRIFEAGFTAVRGDQPEEYYLCIFQELQAGGREVPSDLPVRGYRARLAGGGYMAPPAPRRPPPQPLPEHLVMRGMRGAADAELPAPAAAPRRRRVLELGAQDLEALAVPAAMPEHNRAAPEIPEAAAAPPDLPEAGQGEAEPLVLRQRRRGPLLPDGIPNTLDGQRVHLVERVGAREAPGIRILCPLHTEGGQVCNKYRVCSTASTRSCGPSEPAAYLGAWLLAGPACATRERHMAFVPTAAEVRQHADRQGWLQSAPR